MSFQRDGPLSASAGANVVARAPVVKARRDRPIITTLLIRSTDDIPFGGAGVVPAPCRRSAKSIRARGSLADALARSEAHAFSRHATVCFRKGCAAAHVTLFSSNVANQRSNDVPWLIARIAMSAGGWAGSSAPGWWR
jgi:hypothetical protein